jgi:DNA invertase Pin-like site-specific DNA recombinase
MWSWPAAVRRTRVRLRTSPHRDQNPDALAAAGCEQIFIDKASGKLARRPELDKALMVARRPGDQLVVTKLDRLGRSLENLIDLPTQLQRSGVDATAFT